MYSKKSRKAFILISVFFVILHLGSLANKISYSFKLYIMKSNLHKQLILWVSFMLCCTCFIPQVKSLPTLCVPVTTLPFTENFDHTPGGNSSNGLLPSCWSMNVSNSNYKPYVSTQTSSTHADFVTAYGALDFHNAPATTNIVILPEFDLSSLRISIRQLQVDFKAKVRNVNNGTFIIGVMDDPEDATTFVPVDTIAPFKGNNVWETFSILLSNYEGEGNYIAFVWKDAGTYSVLLDDIYIDVAVECPKPVSLIIDSTTSSNIYCSWVDSVASSWEAVCVPLHSTPNWNQSTWATTHAAAFSNLLPNTRYEIYVRALCAGVGATESFPASIRTTTKCGDITEDMLPYKEPFDQYGSGTNIFPACWSRVGTTTNISTTHFSTPGSLRFYAENSLIAATEKFDMDISTLQLAFKLRGNNTRFGFIVGVMTNPSESATFMPIDTVFVPTTNTWADYIVYLNKYNGTAQYIAFKIDALGSSAIEFYMDDLVVDKTAHCAIPNRVTVSYVKDDRATIHWRANGDETAWQIAYGTPGFDPDDEESIIEAATNPFTISSLAENTMYEVYVRASCGEEKSKWSYVPVTFSTTPIPASIPYQHDFEEEYENENWVLCNGTQTNKWHIGAALNNTPSGATSLYISNTNGLTNAYSNSTTYVYAARAIEFTEPGVYDLTFDWKAYGEGSVDLLRVFLIPTSVVLQGGNNFGISGLSTPNQWTDLVGGKLNLVNTWNNKTVEFALMESGMYNLVFYWTNNASGGGGSAAPAAVDNISITKQLCPTPQSVTTTDITHSDATIQWTQLNNTTTWELRYGQAGFKLDTGVVAMIYDTPNYIISALNTFSAYDVYVRAICGNGDTSNWSNKMSFKTTFELSTIPYNHDFEDDDENSRWGLLNGKQDSKWYIGTGTHHGGAKSLYISNTGGTTNAYSAHGQIMASESYVYALKSLHFEAGGTHEISFDWRANGEIEWDLMRLFLVPASIAITENSAHGMEEYKNTTPSGWMDLGGRHLRGAAEWEQFVSKFAIQEAGMYNLVFFWKNDDYTVFDPPAAIDNISIRLQTCPYPSNLAVTDVGADIATLSWTENGTATAWEIEYDLTGFELGTGTHQDAYGTVHTLTGLKSDFAMYDVYVRAVCGFGNASGWIGPVSFQTTQFPAPLPYQHDFEKESENARWGLINGTYTNKWCIGTADNNTNGGTKALYISGSDGATNNYIVRDESYTYAMRALHFNSAGTYEIAFDWKAGGYVAYDLLRAFLVPAAVKIESGNGFNMLGAMNNVPSGWIDIGNGILNQKTLWQHHYTTVNMPDAGDYNLVFFWKNYSISNGAQPSGTVDNISIRLQTCFLPTALAVVDVTGTSASLTWTETGTATQWEVQYGYIGFALGSGTAKYVAGTTTFEITDLEPIANYDVYIRAICGDGDTSHWTSKTTFKTLCEEGMSIARLPYLENFDSYAIGTAIPNSKRDVIPDCWIVRKSDLVEYAPYIANLGAAYSQSAPYSLNFAPTNNGFSLAIMPDIDDVIALEEIQLSFWGRAVSEKGGTFHVGIMSNPYEDSTFTSIDTLNTFNLVFQKYTINLAAYTGTGGRIAFKWENGNDNSFLLDDVELAFLCSPPASTSILDITDHAATVTWPAKGTEISWIIEYKRTTDDNYSTPNIITTPSYPLTNLDANTDYTVRLRTICGENWVSEEMITTFKTLAVTYMIIPSAGANGTITPADTVWVSQGANQTFTFTPDDEYEVKEVTVNGAVVGSGSTHTIENVSANMTIHVEFVLTDAISKHQLNNSIQIRPNPASTHVTVELTAAFERIEIINLLGQVIYTANVNDNDFTINVSDYRAGVYFIRLSGRQGVATKRFVKE